MKSIARGVMIMMIMRGGRKDRRECACVRPYVRDEEGVCVRARSCMCVYVCRVCIRRDVCVKTRRELARRATREMRTRDESPAYFTHST